MGRTRYDDWTPTPEIPPAPNPQPKSDPVTPIPGAEDEWPDNYTGAESYFDPNKGTVQGQLQGLLESPNALMKQQESQALQAANARGLLNSSIATEAGQSALIGAAMPVAQQDAEAYRKMYSQDAAYDMEKDFELQSQKFQKMMQTMNLEVQERMQERGLETDVLMQEKSIAAERSLQDSLLAAQERIKLMDISSEEKQMMASAYSGIVNNIVAQISSLWRDTELTSDAIFAGIDEMLGTLDESFVTIADLFGYTFDFA